MTRKEIRALSVPDKTKRVISDMAAKKFNSIEEACKFYDFSPASYYNHAKKVGPKTKTFSGVILPETSVPMNKEELIEALRRENAGLRQKVQEEELLISKLQKKLLNLVLADA